MLMLIVDKNHGQRVFLGAEIMRFRRSTLALCTVAALVSGCRGGGPGAGMLPAAAPAPDAGLVHAAAGALRGYRPATSGNIVFAPIGPTKMQEYSFGQGNSGKANAMVWSPKNPKTIYVAGGWGTGLETYSSAGVLRTTDGGASWQSVMNGLVDPAGLTSSVIDALWMDRSNPSILLAGSEYDGVYRTTDGGNSWKNVYPTNHATEFATDANGGVHAATAAGLLFSSDAGATWKIEAANTATGHPTALGGVSSKDGKAALYAGFSDGTIWSMAANGTWTKAGKLPFNPKTYSPGTSSEVHQIAADPLNPSIVYASENNGYWDQDLFASTDAGHSWHEVLPKKYLNLGLGTQAIAFSQVHPHKLYLGTDGAFFILDGSGGTAPLHHLAARVSVIDIRNVWTMANGKDDACWIASDQGLDYVPACSTRTKQIHDDVVSKTAATGLARRFAVSPNGKTVIVSMQDFDSFITTDAGKSWQFGKGFLYEDGFNEVRPGNPKVCYSYDQAWGFRISNDGCLTYALPTKTQQAIAPDRIMTAPIAFDPTNPLHMYLMSGPSLGYKYHVGEYETTDGGTTFTPLAWPGINEPGAIVIDPHNAKHMIVGDIKAAYFSAPAYSSLDYTNDGGQTWHLSAGVPSTSFWYAITVSPVNGQLVLASSMDANDNVFVLRSTNGGKSFTKVATVSNTPLLVHAREEGDEERGAPPQAYVYSPEREIRYNQDVTKGTPDVAITTLRGAYLSGDNGSTWHRLDGKLVAHSFWGIRWVNGYLYLGSDGQGIVRSTTPVQLP